MIEPMAIIDRVKSLLAESFPGEPVYDKRLPEQFQRPSCYVEFLTRKTEDANLSLLEVEDLFQVTGFVPTDDYYDSKASAVYLKAKMLNELFGAHSLNIGDRWLHVSKTENVSGLDYTVVSVTLKYLDDAPNPKTVKPKPKPDPKLIEKVFINRKEI